MEFDGSQSTSNFPPFRVLTVNFILVPLVFYSVISSSMKWTNDKQRVEEQFCSHTFLGGHGRFLTGAAFSAIRGWPSFVRINGFQIKISQEKVGHGWVHCCLAFFTTGPLSTLNQILPTKRLFLWRSFVAVFHRGKNWSPSLAWICGVAVQIFDRETRTH